jgi:adenylate cyclase
MRMLFTRLWRFNNTVLGLLLIATVFLLLVLDPIPLQRLELLASDLRFRIRGTHQPGPEVVIVAIDEKSIDQLGRWPWPYTVQARLVDQLVAYGAAVIGYDVVFSSSDTSAGIDTLRDLRAKLLAEVTPTVVRPEGTGGEAVTAANGHLQTEALTPFLDRAIAEAEHDQRFADALQRSERTVLGYFFHFGHHDVDHLSEDEMQRFLQNVRHSKYNAIIKQPGVNVRDVPLGTAWAVESNLAVLSQAAWGSGFFNNTSDTIDGVIRRYPLIVKYRDQVDIPGEQDYLFPPLGIRVLERYVHGQTTFWLGPTGVEKVGVLGRRTFQVPTDASGAMLINHLGAGGQFPRYSVVDIVEGRHDAAPPAAFRGKIVLIGATAEGLKDVRVTPFDPVFPGVEIHATAIDNMLRGDFLRQPWWDTLYVIVSMLVLGGVLIVLLPRLGAVWGGVVTAGLLLASVMLNYSFFVGSGIWLSVVYPLLTTVVVAAGVTLNQYVNEEKDKRFLRKTFSTYVSPELIAQMVQAKTEPKLGGDSGIRTAFFTDIASFSSFSEVLTATELVELLNEYLTGMTDILLAEGGTLDKYEGDAIVAFFGAPVPMHDHAARALCTALGMQAKLAELRAKWAAEGEKWPELVKQMRMRIGMSSGDMVTGNMGSAMRMNYTMMGDVVNTASRLEAAAKQYGIYIHCTTDTLHMAGADAFAWRYIDKAIVVGKSEPVETVEVVALKGQLSEQQVHMHALYHQGLQLYRQQQWDEAQAVFTESEKLEEVFPKRPTNPSRVYIERCEFFRANPPGADWDGSWQLMAK